MIRPLAFLILLAAAPAACARPVPGYGTVSFPTSCAPAVQPAFDTAVARLHDFDGPEDAFRAIAAKDGHCAMAWWGAAMTVRGNPLAGAPPRQVLEAGRAYLARARAAGPVTAREAGFLAAAEVYFRDPGEDHNRRTHAYEAAMRDLAARFPDDVEVQSFYALAILEAVDLTDKTYARQREAGRILERLWAANPGHPGAPHYLIHAYDYPPLAAGALPAARRYAFIAPAAAHAQHMPSHIYSMLGMWQDSIAANRMAASVEDGGTMHGMAQMDAEDPHGMDFIAYAHLQLGQDKAVTDALARAQPSAERTLVAARYVLERHDWAGAAAMPVPASAFDAMTVRFVRALGAARSGDGEAARMEAASLRALHDPVLRQSGAYWAGLVNVYATAADAWAARAAGDADTAARLMAQAAALDDGREKHILLENKLLPMRELYGDLLLDLGRPADALAAYQASQASAPNRFNAFLGMARAARALGRADDERRNYAQAAALVIKASPGRLEIDEARQFAVPPP